MIFQIIVTELYQFNLLTWPSNPLHNITKTMPLRIQMLAGKHLFSTTALPLMCGRPPTLGRLCYTYPCVIHLDVLVLIFFNKSHLNIQFSPKNSSVPPYYRPIPFYSSIYFKKSSLRTFSYYSFNLEVPKPL